MEILILSKSRGTAGRIRLSGFLLVMLFLAVAGAGSATVYFGYRLGGDAMAERMLNDPAQTSALWQREIIQQRRFLHRLRADLDADLSALSGSLGSLQGDVRRLNAVADRVAQNARIDAEEFAFADPVAVGGPQTGERVSQPPRWSGLLENLRALEIEVAARDSRLTALEALLADMRHIDNNQPGGRPLQEGWISSGYGYRTDPVSGRREFHGGVDFAGKAGTEIKAVAAGVVTWSGKRWGYGNLVELNHGNGYVTRYAHNRKNLVRLGEKVEKNQTVALLGSSGRATGPHVHFEVVHRDRTVNPWKFVRRHAN